MRYSGIVLHSAQSSLTAPFLFMASVESSASVPGNCLQNYPPFPDCSTCPPRVFNVNVQVASEIGMPWTVEYVPERDRVLVTASGEIRDEDARAQTAQALDLLKHNQVSAVLVDYSDALSEVSLPNLYGQPDYYSQTGAPWHVSMAVVLPRTRYRLESYQFFELVCQNAGYNVKLFETKDAAEDWLAKAPPVRQHVPHPAHA
jgi:hypothetical protein